MRLHRPTRHRPALGGLALALALGALVGPTIAQAGVTVPYAPTSSVQLAPGITHAKGGMRTTNGIQAVQVATIDMDEPSVRLKSLLSNGKVVKLERPTDNANRNSKAGYRAIVATNGDVSVAGQTGALAAPLSLHVSNGEVFVAQECAKPTLGLDADGTLRMENVRVRTRLYSGDARPFPEFYWNWVSVGGVNTNRLSNEIIVYTPRFGTSTLTDNTGHEVVLQTSGRIKPFGMLDATVVSIRRNTGNTTLQPGQIVLSATGTFKAELDRLWVGLDVQIETVVLDGDRGECGPPAVEKPAWGGVVEAVGGNYFVAKDGQVAAPSASEYSKGAIAAPRTSVGITADGRILMVVVDGRQSGYSVGVTLAEMGQLMLQLGAVRAINLDGGGSTVMGTRLPGAATLTVSNRPSDGRERNLTQALTIFSTAP